MAFDDRNMAGGAIPPGGQSVREMFDRISGTYDLLKHLLSLGQDYRWRKVVTTKVRQGGCRRVADFATETGHLRSYMYLNRSVEDFYRNKDVVGMMEKYGFENVSSQALTFGVARMCFGKKRT